jgi:hypothetical protein
MSGAASLRLATHPSLCAPVVAVAILVGSLAGAAAVGKFPDELRALTLTGKSV